MIPGGQYLELHRSGELTRRARALTARLQACDICPRTCGADRRRGADGTCRSGHRPVIAQAAAHFGEEAPLVGRSGSGTIFFAGCTLACIFCQNYDISHRRRGEELGIEKLAGMMLGLQKQGCHNINLVTPTHFVPQIVAALEVAAGAGLTVPLVYNCGGYESLETLQALEGIIDIYMPDMKYWDDAAAWTYSGVQHYRQTACAALLEMHRQVGDLEIDGEGIARRGLLIRHLVLPDNLAGTRRVLEFIAGRISRDSYVNIMAQYRPAFEAWRRPELNRTITLAEFRSALSLARSLGLHRGFQLPWNESGLPAARRV